MTLGRRNFNKLIAASMLGLPFKESKSSTATFDALVALQSTKTTTGKYPGSYFNAPLGYTNWYWANSALYPFIKIIPNDIANYIDKYIKATYDSYYDKTSSLLSSNKDFTRIILDVSYDGYLDYSSGPSGVNYGLPKNAASGQFKFPDSNDAYAGTFLTLFVGYIRYQIQLSQNNQTAFNAFQAWLTAIPQGMPNWVWANKFDYIKDIAYYNIATQQQPSTLGNGVLINCFQKVPSNSNFTGYLMDNCEVYRGIKDIANLFSDLLRVSPNFSSYYKITATERDYYVNLAKSIQSGIHDLYDNSLSKNYFYPNNTTQTPTLGDFYHMDALQVAPRVNSALEGLSDDVSKYSNALVYLNNDFGPKTTQSSNALDWTKCNVDTFPWMMIGYASALQGDATSKQNAITQQTTMEGLYSSSSTRGLVTIHEIGYYKRISDVLNGTLTGSTYVY